MKKSRSALCFCLCLAAALPMWGCGLRAETASGTAFGMDTYIRMSLYGKNAEDALSACQERIAATEALLSVTLPESDIARINAASGAAVSISEETEALLDRSLALMEETEGCFNIFVLPACRAWGFVGGKAYAVPSEETRAALAQTVRDTALTLDGGTAALSGAQDAGLDLGGIAKGYLGVCLAELCRERGIESALFDLGGNVQLVGAKPDGSPWRVGVRSPDNADAVVGYIEAQDTALVTAGSYERYFEENDVRYHHILNPKSCAPAESGLVSVTVIMQDGTAADALSTGLFVMGAERASALWRSRKDFEMVLILSDGSILCTPDAGFTALNGNDYKLITI